MKKKIFCLIAAMVILAFSVCGCKQQPLTPSTQPTQTENQTQTQPDTQPQVQSISLLDALCEDYASDDIHTEITIYQSEGKHYHFDSRNSAFCASFFEYLKTTQVVSASSKAFVDSEKEMYIHIKSECCNISSFRINEKGWISLNSAYFQGDGIYEALLQQIDPFVKENEKYCQAVEETSDTGYIIDYSIWNEKGEVMYEGNSHREDRLVLIDDRIVHRWGQAGTGLSTRWAVFYDVTDGRVSPSYSGQTDSCGELVLQVDHNAVIISDMFSGEELYRIDDFEFPLAEMVEPIGCVYFINDGKQIAVSYADKDFEWNWQIFDLPVFSAPDKM